MKKLSFILFLMCSLFASDYEKGKEIFIKKCASCHIKFVPEKEIKENFFEKNNTLLKLIAPSVNMMHWAIVKGPKRIGEEGDDEFRVGEITDFLEDYLYSPEKDKSICDPMIMKFYKIKKSLKGKVSKDELWLIANYLLNFTPPENNKVSKMTALRELNINTILKDAKRDNKYIIIEASASDCHYCKLMKNSVLNQNDIQKLLTNNYIFKEVMIDKQKLPEGLDKAFLNITPTFFILNSKGEPIDMLVGVFKKEDFKQKLKGYLKK